MFKIIMVRVSQALVLKARAIMGRAREASPASEARQVQAVQGAMAPAVPVGQEVPVARVCPLKGCANFPMTR